MIPYTLRRRLLLAAVLASIASAAFFQLKRVPRSSHEKFDNLRSSARRPASEIERKISALIPTAEEDRWLQINWRSNLGAAREEAQLAGKPLFLWIMNGNPLGCT
jgi:hypothetical protein